MNSFGARFNKTDYIRVDINFYNGESEVFMTTEVEGTPVTVKGAIQWDEPSDGDGELG